MPNPSSPDLEAMAEEVLGRHYEHEDYALCDCGENWPCDASRLASAALGVVGERDAAIKLADVGWAEVAACHRQLGDYVEAVALAEEKLESSQAREKALQEALDTVLRSAHPHPRENPSMAAAWAFALAAIAAHTGEPKP